MKPLGEKALQKRKVLLKAIEDYFGERIPQEKFERIRKALQTRSTLGLDEEERKAVWSIRTNLEDPVYIGGFRVA